ncbi:MAG: tryptophan 7-halogenase [Nocardioidaceae bacterium]
MRTFPSEFDVIVAGGGPAGSATAGLLAQKGHHVLLLEREKFPRYHVGESLVTGSVPTLEELGVRERLDAMGTVKKYGGTLLWGADQGTWDFRFAEVGHHDYAYQVRRADFDSLLLTRARELGVAVLEETNVKEPIFDGDRIVGVEYQDRNGGEVKTARCRMFIDASGQQHLLARRFKLLEWQEDLRNLAVWSYFAGCELYEGTYAGDVITENRPDGWLWFIPLSDNTVSIGYVTPTESAKRSGNNLEALFHRELEAADEVRRLSMDAYPVSQFRTARDWSYTCHRFHGPGWALIGDAAAFVDPLLASGVTLALLGARGLSDTLDLVLRNPEVEEHAMSVYDNNYRDFLGTVLDFVRFFYDRTRNKEEYWEKAQAAIDPEGLRPQKQDFAIMLSGTIGLHEVFEASAGTLLETS